MKTQLRLLLAMLTTCLVLSGCTDADSGSPSASFSSSSSSSASTSDAATTTGGTPAAAFRAFNPTAVSVSFSGDSVTVNSTGLPDHTSPYWPTSSSQHIDPISAVAAQMSPGTITARGYSLTVPSAPQLASSTSATGLGAIGIATTGAPIFNELEGPSGSLSAQVASGFDYAGGHMGPTGYHYHLESQAANGSLSHNDTKLVGIMQDGFLLYGRKCSSTGGYPSDLDSSGGHVSSTQHGEGFYHYHVVNRTFVNGQPLLFGGDLKGTPNAIGQ